MNEIDALYELYTSQDMQIVSNAYNDYYDTPGVDGHGPYSAYADYKD